MPDDHDVVDIDSMKPHWMGRGICLRCLHVETIVMCTPVGTWIPPVNTECGNCGAMAVLGFNARVVTEDDLQWMRQQEDRRRPLGF